MAARSRQVGNGLAPSVMGVENLKGFRVQLLSQPQNPMSVAGIVRGHGEHSKARHASALFERAAVPADDELLVAALPQAAGQQQDLVLPAPHFFAGVNVNDFHSVRQSYQFSILSYQ